MNQLHTKTCEACRVGAPLATADEIAAYKQDIPDWQLVEIDGIKRLSRCYEFNDFNEALSFTNKIGVIAEQQGHHPAILTEWGKVTVSWWSHKIKGLHLNDFIMAARTESLLES